ncbi:MAG: SDR family oxidoreductase [Alphaproteobacteria bacterium]|nr:SDR family oxidoreductase [Alphaproteobacteria bacterium]
MSYQNPPPLAWAGARLKDRVVFVTGAASGIGAAAVRRFAAEGASVVAASRRADPIEALAAELRGEGLPVAAVTCDVRDETSVEAAIAFTVARFGRLDGAFNNAGVGGVRAPFTELPVDSLEAVMATNLRGPFLCMKHQIAAMLASGGGSIVNTSSIGGMVGAAGNGIYAASKWALTGLTRCVALEYARRNIRVNCIAPGATRSEMFDRWIPTDEGRAALADAFPMNYIAHPDDMARAALYLLSDEARWTTGAVLPCEGGAHAD